MTKPANGSGAVGLAARRHLDDSIPQTLSRSVSARVSQVRGEALGVRRDDPGRSGTPTPPVMGALHARDFCEELCSGDA